MLSTMFANDVRQTLDQFRRSVDQMFEGAYGQPAPAAAQSGANERGWSFSPVLESGWNDTSLNLRAVLPGVAEKDIHVSLQNNQLIIEGERRAPEGFQRNTWTQLAYGKFYAAVTLPGGLDLDKLNCRLTHGILEIQVPLSEASKRRQIQIRTADHAAISA
jgi:HSP20 family protein